MHNFLHKLDAANSDGNGKGVHPLQNVQLYAGHVLPERRLIWVCDSER